MIIGSVLAKCSKIELSTADEKTYSMNNNFISKLALKIIGLPHLGFRMRASIVLKEAMKSPKDAKILDAGCGYGIYSLTLAQYGYKNINSIDIEKVRIDNINNTLKELGEYRDSIKTHQGSLTKLPFEDNIFDTIICSEVIEHIADHESAIKELSRVLKKGGKLILTVPYNSKNNQRIYKMFGHERPGYTENDLANAFSPYNIKIQKTWLYEYWLGDKLFKSLYSITFKPLLGILFYPFYILYILDSYIKIGEPNAIAIVAKKD